jgi:hypothetical protein
MDLDERDTTLLAMHLDPQDITITEVAVDLCDAPPLYAEENTDQS